jgi:ribA/ribD-fused uncharacterized protein
MKTTDTMVLFWQDKDIYSNFYPSPFTVDGKFFQCSEQYFMYCKAVYFNDHTTAAEIMAEPVPLKCKKLGRRVKNYDESAWDKVRELYMFDACFNKFRQNQVIKEQLLATGSRLLVEASPFDKIWGIGLAEDNDDALDTAKWRGSNLLGKVLMDVREKLKGSVEQ